jgi:hypothetical protein
MLPVVGMPLVREERFDPSRYNQLYRFYKLVYPIPFGWNKVSSSFTGNKDIDTKILIDLPDRDLSSYCQVDKYAAYLCSDDNMWKTKYEIEYPNGVPKPNIRSWRDHYILTTGQRYPLKLNSIIRYGLNNIDDPAVLLLINVAMGIYVPPDNYDVNLLKGNLIYLLDSYDMDVVSWDEDPSRNIIKLLYNIIYPFDSFRGDYVSACSHIKRDIKKLCYNKSYDIILRIGVILNVDVKTNTSLETYCGELLDNLDNECLNINPSYYTISAKTGLNLDPIHVNGGQVENPPRSSDFATYSLNNIIGDLVRNNKIAKKITDIKDSLSLLTQSNIGTREGVISVLYSYLDLNAPRIDDYYVITPEIRRDLNGLLEMINTMLYEYMTLMHADEIDIIAENALLMDIYDEDIVDKAQMETKLLLQFL